MKGHLVLGEVSGRTLCLLCMLVLSDVMKSNFSLMSIDLLKNVNIFIEEIQTNINLTH